MRPHTVFRALYHSYKKNAMAFREGGSEVYTASVSLVLPDKIVHCDDHRGKWQVEIAAKTRGGVRGKGRRKPPRVTVLAGAPPENKVRRCRQIVYEYFFVELGSNQRGEDVHRDENVGEDAEAVGPVDDKSPVQREAKRKNPEQAVVLAEGPPGEYIGLRGRDAEPVPVISVAESRYVLK